MKTSNLRVRLNESQLRDIDIVRRFLGLDSMSATVARLASWNASVLANSLLSDGSQTADAVGVMAGDIARLAVRSAIKEVITK